jgi:TadE-like protein
VLRKRQRGQSIVEFGIIAILFTLIMFAIADFGLLLNDWLSVSSAARLLARDASLGMNSCSPTQCVGPVPELWNEANAQPIPGVTKDPYFSSRYCCEVPNGTPTDHGAAVQLMVTYYKQCTPPVSGCQWITAADQANFDNRFSSNDPTNPTNVIHGGCSTWTIQIPCAHPAPPGPANSCPVGTTSPCPGDVVVLTLKAAGAQVITPLVRPFFGGPACPDTSTPSRCYVALNSSVTMRFEGDLLF